MSNALAIAGVTAVLRDLLDSGLIDHEVTDAMGQGVSVTAVAPDTVRVDGPEAKPQLNIFLHQATPNAAMRNLALPSRDRNGQRLSNPPLALDLHYLVTAYGISDLQAEVLLGYAMQLLHETPMLSRDAIRTALNPTNAPISGSLLPAVYEALRASDLAEQYEQIKITPAPMNTEEMSKLWSAIQAHYRPTAAYQVSVALIEATQPARSPLPVLSRGPSETSLVDPTKKRERGIAVTANLRPTYPQVDEVELPNQELAAHLGDTVTLKGHLFDGANQTLLLDLPRLDIERAIAPPSALSAAEISFVIPNQPANYPAGNYLMALQVLRPGETEPRVSEQISLRIAPQMTSLVSPPQVFNTDPDGTALVTISCTPQVRPTQRVSLIIGSREVVADDHPTTTANLSFTVLDAPIGVHHVRLRVDGVDSQLVDRSKSPPEFLDQRIEIA
jgi:hypothetical protein